MYKIETVFFSFDVLLSLVLYSTRTEYFDSNSVLRMRFACQRQIFFVVTA